ncbi:lipocalin-like domain-containing protein [Luteibacter yeojuensis]|uniref:Lipocalin-like domain-containing protein n=1 Tax=Luteibacter yeojuensis TaxID=345309 RepID=A0A7X5QVC6_9GAMM|nr:lipocalin-like domain-containing protein [Luteibacter yeojuensis]NID16108.1 lipocalin-like domain-containing protein [Luteibacter yeojuensis]
MNLSKVLSLGALTFLAAHAASAAETRSAPAPATLEGTWALAFADVVHPDGTRGHDYGNPPKGVLHVDRAGHYAMFIFNPGRSTFAANDKSKGTPEEYRGAIMGTSSHYGTVEMDPAAHTLTFHVDGSTYPNWEGATQVRHYRVDGDVLSYQVAARPNGDIPMTGWRRLQP